MKKWRLKSYDDHKNRNTPKLEFRNSSLGACCFEKMIHKFLNLWGNDEENILKK